MLTTLLAGLGAILGGIVTYFANKDAKDTDLRLLKTALGDAAQKVTALETEKAEIARSLAEARAASSLHISDAQKYYQVRDRLQKSRVIRSFLQPVLLVGPRMVGKTSLLTQWHAPWDRGVPDRTASVNHCKVPVCSLVEKEKDYHFADPELLVEVETQLLLSVYDFPGEVKAQPAIREAIVAETRELRQASKKRLGVVLICMFDAEEAKADVSLATREYYNGDLFRELRSLVAFGEVDLERLIFVFNKYDCLKLHCPGMDDAALLQLCIAQFDHVFQIMRTVCSPDKVCEVFTILSREEMHFKNQGAPIVLGEAARGLVTVFGGNDERAQSVIASRATNLVGARFM